MSRKRTAGACWWKASRGGEAASAWSCPDEPSTPNTGARILIVEDEHAMRVALRDILDSEGYRAQTAADGEAGLQLAVAEKPDLILLDVMMPKLDGYALCAELRRLAIRTPVLMVTAKGQVPDRVTGLDSGADDYLVKPFSTEELLARVRALLRRLAGKPPCAARDRDGRRADRSGETDGAEGGEAAASGGEGICDVASARRSRRRAGVAAAVPGSGLGRDGISHNAHRGQPHRRPAGEARRRMPKNPRWIVTVHGIGYRLEGAECDFAEV